VLNSRAGSQMNFLVFFISMSTQTLQQAQQEVQDLKFEILEQVAAENFDWTRRIFRRTDRTASTNLRIKLDTHYFSETL